MNKATKRNKKGQFKKGGKGGPGRPKKNAIKTKETIMPQDVQKAFLEAFDEAMGVKGLKEFIDKSYRNKTVFLQLIARLIPEINLATIQNEQRLPLVIEVVETPEGMKEIEGRIRQLEFALAEKDRVMDIYKRALRRNGVIPEELPELKHEPIREKELPEHEEVIHDAEIEEEEGDDRDRIN